MDAANSAASALERLVSSLSALLPVLTRVSGRAAILLKVLLQQNPNVDVWKI